MQIYEVRISHGARVDMAELRKFLKSMMTVEGAIRYANNMREEIKTLAFYADLFLKYARKKKDLILQKISQKTSFIK